MVSIVRRMLPKSDGVGQWVTYQMVKVLSPVGSMRGSMVGIADVPGWTALWLFPPWHVERRRESVADKPLS